jgi:hypothetical protein
MAIADIFEALTASDRPYKKAKSLSESVRILSFFKNDGHIDADLFDLFLTSGVYRRYGERFLKPEQLDAVDISRYVTQNVRLSHSQLLDLGRAPFHRDPRQSPDAAAIDILAAFATISGLPDKLSQTFSAITACSGVKAPAPLVVAGQSLARLIDSGVGAGRGNAYHNAQHFCEVMLCACFLALLDELEPDSIMEVVLAAMIHDFHHDGQVNGQNAFRLERRSVSEAMADLVQAGVPDLQRQNICALVLATDLAHGLPIAHACHAYHAGAVPMPTIHPLAPELARLVADPALARKALLVSEADVLPSVGLSIEYALQMQAPLSQEWGRPLDLQDKYRFVTQTFPGLIVGNFFAPNVERLRQFLLQQVGLQSP